MATQAGSLPLQLEPESRRSSALIFVGLIAILVGIGLGLTVYPGLAVLAAVPPALLLLNWIWREPVRGFYLVIAGTFIFEIFPLGFPDSLTDKVPFFLNLNNANSSAGLSGIPIAPAEILMLSVIVIWFVAGVAHRNLTLVGGPLVSAYVAFALIVLATEVHGILGRGDWLKSLWEVRPQAYGFIAFLLAANLIKTRRHMLQLTVVVLVAVAIKVGIALFRFFVTLHGNDAAYEAIMAHEESYFFALFILATLVAAIWGRGLNRRIMFVLVVGAALSFFAMLVNHRRSAELALIAGAAVVMVLAIRFDDKQRGRWLGLTLLVVVAVTILTVGYWNHTTGLVGELVRPIRSLFVPDQRDYLSNIYRVAENANIQFTFKSSPLFGTGFGIPMIVIFPMADISYVYPLWNYIPHNTVLWIGMRMGALGYVAFFGLLAMAILQACRQLATRRDPLINSFAAFAVAAIVAEMIQGYNDLQLDSYRNLIVFGAVLGLINRLPQLADA
jgi:phosphate starvation-inducible membrane PsiE